jgi:hypothetical protein
MVPGKRALWVKGGLEVLGIMGFLLKESWPFLLDLIVVCGLKFILNNKNDRKTRLKGDKESLSSALLEKNNAYGAIFFLMTRTER